MRRVLDAVLTYNRGPMLPETHTLRREEAAVKTSIIRFISIVCFWDLPADLRHSGDVAEQSSDVLIPGKRKL